MKVLSCGTVWRLTACGWLVACSGNDSVVVLPAAPGVPTSTEPSTPAGREPLYVLANEVYDADSSTSYVNVLTSLDIAAMDYTKGIEHAGGRATIQTYDGWLYVAGPETPVINRFAVNADGTLTPSGEVSFGNYAFETLLSVFHAENATIDAETAPAELMATNNWRVWALDVQAQSASPLLGLDWMAVAASTLPRFDLNGWSFQLLEMH